VGRTERSVWCLERIPTRLEGKFYKCVVRLATLYGSECWTVDEKIGEDRIRNEYIRGSVGGGVKMWDN